MADLGTIQTDERMRSLVKRLDAIYNEALRTALKNEKEWINKLTSLPKDAPLEKRTAFANEAIRRGEQVNRISAEIANTGEIARRLIDGEMTNIYGLNYDFTSYALNRLTGLDLNLTLYDRNQIASIMRETQSPFTKIAYNSLGSDAQIVRKLQNQLAQSVIIGESQQRLVQRIRSVTNTKTWQAKRIAQTERVRVQSEGRQLALDEAAEIGLETEKQWISRMDERVRDDHAAVTGEVVDRDEPFSNGLMYPGDPDGEPADIINCRCVMTYRLKNKPAELAKHYDAFDRQLGFDEWRERRSSRRDTAEIRENYRSSFSELQTSNNITVKTPSAHFIERSIERGINAENVINALTNPLHIGKIRIDNEGRPSQTFIGKYATVSINPKNGVITTTYKTGRDRIKKYGGDKSET